MVSKKTDIKKPSKTTSLRAPKKKAAQSKTKCSHHHAPKDKTIDIVKELKTIIAELERFASFPRLNPNPVLEVDSSGEIIFINNAAKDILRKLNLEKEGDVFLPKDIHTILRGLNHKEEKEFCREITIQNRVFRETLHLAPEFNAVRIYAHDITERKRMETGIRRAEISLSEERDFTSAVLSTAGALVVVLDLKGRIVSFNKTCERVTGYFFDEVKGKPFWDIFLVPEEIKPVKSVFKELKAGQFPNKHENYWLAKDGTHCLVSWSNTALLDSNGNVEYIIGTGIDITDRKKADDALRLALKESQQHQYEISALLEGSSVVLRYRDFMDAAGAIFKSCKNVIGAASGYIAMVSDDGTKNEVIFLDSGDLLCTVDPGLPMPIRGMRGEVYSSGNAIYHNDFPQSGWAHFLPDGHVQLENVLMAPMIVEKKVVGLFGLGNKPGGFNENDVRITNAFSEFAAIALLQKRAEEELRGTKDALQEANEELESKVLERTDELSKAYEVVATERQRLFSVLEEIPAYVCLLTADYKFAYVNQEFKRRFGDPGDRPCHEHLFSRQKPCEICQTFMVFVEQKTQQWEWTGPDGNTYAIFDYPFTDIDGSSLILELGIDITKRKIAEDELKESREQLRNLYTHQQLAVEAERTKIAREIHDEFGTILTALNIDLSWLGKKLPGDQHVLIERISKDVELINSAIKVVQRISSELRPGVLDYLGLSSAVEWQVKEFGNRTGIDWDIAIDMTITDLDKDISIALFRILQESLTNVARHAEASKIRVNLVETDSILTLDVTDDGKGISEEQLSDPRSLGILGMRERVHYLGGDINIKAAPDKGTTVTVRVPLAKQGYEKGYET